MSWFWLVPIAVGTAVVAQGTLNREMGKSLGLSTAVFINAVVFFLCCLIYLLLNNGIGATLWAKVWREFQWWQVIPGICGFIIVAGIPFAIPVLGASRVFLVVILMQIVLSLLWDTWVESIPLSTWRLAGAVITAIGVGIISYR